MRKLRVKKKIAKSNKQLDPIFSDDPIAAPSKPVAQGAKSSPVVATSSQASTPVSATKVKPKPSGVSPLSKLSISINNAAQKPRVAKKQAEELNSNAQNRSETFTQDQLRAAWNTFADKLGAEKLLQQSMKSSAPILKANFEFELAVSNSFQEKTLADNGARILSYLRNALYNDKVMMHVVVRQQEGHRRAFTASDKYKEMAKKNPALELLKKRLDLELD